MHEPSQGNLFTWNNEKYAVIYCDGASSGNPGKAGIGAVINVHEKTSGKSTLYKISEYIGITTNNIAEYRALIRALEFVKESGVEDVRIFLDSELIYKQIKGQYRVRDKKLIPLWEKVMKILKGLDNYSITHIKRDKNKEADKLARMAISGKSK